MAGFYKTIATLGVLFFLICGFGLTYSKNNLSFAQNVNATAGISGNQSGVGPSEKIIQLGKSFADFNASSESNSSKNSIIGFLEKLRSNESFQNLANDSKGLIGGLR